MASGTTAVYVRWGGLRNRADDLAAALGTQLLASPWRNKHPLTVPLRYVAQFAWTLFVLARTRPAVVYTQHTQPFCSVAALVHRAWRGGCVMTDCHNGAFTDRRWTRVPMRSVHRWVWRHADLNLVHNDAIARHVTEHLRIPGEFMTVAGPLRSLPEAAPTATVVCVCSFDADEPLDELLAALGRLPSTVSVCVTGDASRSPVRRPESAGSHVRFTGYLDDEAYERLLAGAGVVVALSTRDLVLMQACTEAVAAGRPLVTSANEVSRSWFGSGAVLVTNDAASIASGIEAALDARDRLAAEMVEIRRVRTAAWESERRGLLDAVHGCSEAGRGIRLGYDC